MQGGCKPEGGAVAPVAELLSGAGLRVSEHGGDWALLRAGSLLWRGPHCPADPTGLQEAKPLMRNFFFVMLKLYF